MRVARAFLAGMMAMAAFPAAAQEQKFNLGIVVFDDQANPGVNFIDPFVRGLEPTKSRFSVHPATVPRGDFASQAARMRELVEREKVDVLATDAPIPIVKELATAYSSLAFLHLGAAASDQTASLEGLKNVVTFGFLPVRQQDFLVANLAGAKDGFLISSSFVRPALDGLVTAAERAGAGQINILVLDRAPQARSLAADLAAKKVAMVAGILVDVVADQLVSGLAEMSYSNPVLIFSPPPAQTRGFLIGRFIALAVAGGAKDASQVLESFRSAPRFDRASQSIALPWSIRFSRLDETVIQKAGRPEFYGPDRNGIDNTQECSCRDRSGRQVSCKNCEPGKCARTGDGSDQCGTACKTE